MDQLLAAALPCEPRSHARRTDFPRTAAPTGVWLHEWAQRSMCRKVFPSASVRESKRGERS